MDAPSYAFADRAWHGPVRVAEHVRLARDTYRLRVECPVVAQRIVPGQFVMVRLAGCNDPLLGRPLALYETYDGGDARPAGIDIVYVAMGKFTRRVVVAARLGDALELWGPLGNGFAPRTAKHLVMVAGGIGQTPFLALAREALGQRRYGDPPRSAPRAQRVTLCYGTRTSDLLAGVDDFRRLGVEVQLSTDDGSAGHHGLVVDLLRQILTGDRDGLRVVCCGPEKMMAATAKMCRESGVRCDVSLESPMACGVGICFSCVTKVRDGGGWDYRRTCVEGPVFDAEQVMFD
ncbi:MAG: dihydroorotate dehydrogenase electron transfer subunit [Planctomycetia bacterium]|nr:dihydroorotate dehydrogenase electron transfer subunit [Planctomycetia bacterium]